MPVRLPADILKDQPGPSDVHVGTALGNEGGRKRRRPFKPTIGGGNKVISEDGATEGTGAPANKAAKTPAVSLKPFDDDTVHTPFLYDAHAFDRLREDQKPRFLGAVTGPGKLPLHTIRLDNLVAMQNRVDPKKVDAMRGPTTMVGWTKPVVTRFADRDYIADGHHRLTAAALDGLDQYQVHYLDLTRESNALKRADAVEWSMPINVLKTDADRQMIFGWASVVTKGGKAIIDKQGDIIEPAELENAAYDYVIAARQHGDMHQNIGTGRLIESAVFTLEKQAALGVIVKDDVTGEQIEGWWTGFLVEDPAVWKSIKDGKRPEFSIGGFAYPEDVPE